jgi:hypothetical protein
MRTGLVLPYMLGLDVISFFHKHVFVVFFSVSFFNKKKKFGTRCGTLFLSLDSFSDIACVFP